tara:strand:+ start:292 stop:531 length:240 start_codon:yes stop_codon:yes gene_type:complete
MAKNQPITHNLVPKHTKLSEKEKQELLEVYNIIPIQLPKILKKDAAIKSLEAEQGDVIKIIRASKTAKQSIFYRVVIDG